MKELRKLSLFLFGLGTLVFVLSTTMIGQIYKGILFENTYDTAIGSLRQMEYHFNEKISSISNSVIHILAGQGLKNLASEEDVTSVYSYQAINEFNKEVQEVLDYNTEVASILYINNKDVVVGTDGNTVWKEKAGEEFIEKLDGNSDEVIIRGGLDSALLYEKKPYMRVPFEYYITIAVPCGYSYDSANDGILLVNIREKEIRNIFSFLLTAGTGNIYVLDEEGEILSATEVDKIQEKWPLWMELAQQEEPYFVHDSNYIISYEMQKIPFRIILERPEDTFFVQANQLYRILVCVILCSLLIVFICYAIYSHILLKPLNSLVEAMTSIGKGKYGIRIETDARGEIARVIESFNKMSADIERLTTENVRINNEKRILQLLALQEQMSPHFVLNALNTIKWMAMLNREENIVNMVIALSKVIQAFKNTNAFGTIGEEIEFIKSYIEVMNWRYGNVIAVHYQVEKACAEKEIPLFFIQPLVENALKHGFASTNCRGEIYIEVKRYGEILRINVSDNGSGMSEEKIYELNERLKMNRYMRLIDTGGIGLINIAKRIQLYYGEGYGMRIYSNGEAGLNVEEVLPYETTQGGEKDETCNEI